MRIVTIFIMAAKNYDHDYKVYERQIKYQDNDGLSTTLSLVIRLYLHIAIRENKEG